MKKIIFIFILSFLFIFNVDAKMAGFSFYLHGVSPTYIRSVNGVQSYTEKLYIIRRSSTSYVYSLDPFSYLSTSKFFYEYNYNDEYFNLTDEVLNKINVISYFGYEYENHTETKWYAVTQLLIFRELVDDSYFVDSMNGNRINLYEDEIKELNELVNNYYKLPSFSEDSFDYNVNGNYEVIDLNNVLSNYEIENSNIDYVIDDNKLYINTTTIGNYKIDFIRKSPIDREYILYGLEDNKSVIYPGKIDDIRFSININVSSSLNVENIQNKENDEDPLIVEVPNTGVYNYKYKIYPIFMIFIGIFLIIKSFKKTTHHE